jgi:hypothetical protein
MISIWVGLFIFLIILFSTIYIWLALRHHDKVNLLSISSWVALGIAFFMVIHITGLMLYPVKIQEVDQPVKVLNPNHQVKRGEFVILQVNLKKYIDKGSTLFPAILCQDGTYLNFPERKSNLPEGEGVYILSSQYQIPLDAPLSICHTTATDVFKLNLFREKSFIHQSEDFQIIE